MSTSIAADSVKEHLGIDQHSHRLMRLGPWLFGALLVVGIVVAARRCRSSSSDVGGGRLPLLLAVGMIFGYFPARKAARLDPIEALRHE